MEKLIGLELEEIETIIENKERYKVDNLDKANWALRKLKYINDKKDEIETLAKAELERINNWKDKELKEWKDNEDFFNFILTEYYKEQRLLDPKFKLSTPYGKVSSRKQQDEWIYDNDAVLEWLNKNNTDLVRIKYEPLKADIKKLYKVEGNQVITEDGEIVEGITVEEREDSITIKVE